MDIFETMLVIAVTQISPVYDIVTHIISRGTKFMVSSFLISIEIVCKLFPDNLAFLERNWKLGYVHLQASAK